MTRRTAVGRLFGLIKRYRLLFLIAIVLALGASIAALAVPWFGRRALDDVIATRAASDVNHAFLVLGALWLLAASLNFARDVLAQQLGHRIVADLRHDVMCHALQLPITYFDSAHVGEITTRLISDTEQLRRTVAEDFIHAVGDVAMVLGAAVFLFTLDWTLTLALMLVALAAPLGHAWLSPRLRRLNRAAMDAASSTLSRFGEVVANMRLVKSFTRERHEASIAANALATVFRSAVKASRFEAFVWTGAYAAFGLVGLIVVAYGVHRVIAGDLTLGTMLAYFYTLTIVAAPLTSMAGITARAQRAQAAADRIDEILDEPRESDDPSLPDLRVTHGEINFNDVRFAYDAASPVLDGITLTIPAGSTVALVGATGSGKSTLIALLQRFYEPASGDVRVDGVSIAAVSRCSVREAFAVVPQEAMLFDDTIRENIRYGRLDASDGEVQRAAAAAHVDEFSTRLEHGLDTSIGERGVRLSGGQRQRIAIARAILRNAPILLLDEATSALDSESESLVQDAIGAFMAGRTTLVVAHRLRTVESADRIAVLDNGRIVALATHRELMDTSERYRQLFAARAVNPAGATSGN